MFPLNSILRELPAVSQTLPIGRKLKFPGTARQGRCMVQPRIGEIQLQKGKIV